MSEPTVSLSDVERIIAERLSGIIKDNDDKIAAVVKEYEDKLAAAVASAVPVTHSVPFNAGGPGTDIAGSWSQYHQELANSGQLTPEHLESVR